MHTPARYKVYWGGRASAKSWAIAEALIRIAAAKPVRVLCTREFQVSIQNSSHKLLIDTIERLGLQSWFDWTKTSITSRVGAEFIFKGLHQNEQGIRSTEGIDICWVEEGQSVSAASWRSLSPTIRSDGAEIWVTYNMINEEDATHARFHLPDGTLRRKNAIVHKVNYDSNPYFPEVMREEMEEDKALDYHLYEHVWLGMPLRVSDAIVFNNRYRVEDFDVNMWREFPGDDRRLFHGGDFGFANDPATLIRFFKREEPGKPKRLYISGEVYQSHVEVDDYPEFYGALPGVEEWPIKADAARPEIISYLRRKGFSITAAEKWEGSVKDGIAHIRGFEIIIHPSCVNTAREARLYRYKTDPKQVDEKGQPLVLPIIIDKHNHCWDAIRYGLDGYIHRAGALGQWDRLGRAST